MHSLVSLLACSTLMLRALASPLQLSGAVLAMQRLPCLPVPACLQFRAPLLERWVGVDVGRRVFRCASWQGPCPQLYRRPAAPQLLPESLSVDQPLTTSAGELDGAWHVRSGMLASQRKPLHAPALANRTLRLSLAAAPSMLWKPRWLPPPAAWSTGRLAA